MTNNKSDDTGFGLVVLAVVLAVIAFYGEPDIVDAVVYALTGQDVSEPEENTDDQQHQDR